MSYGGWENEERKMRMEKHSVMKIANRNKRIKNKQDATERTLRRRGCGTD